MTIIKYDRNFKSFTYVIDFEGNIITTTVTLIKGSEKLDFDVTVDWKKDAVPQKMIPQLSFAVPVSYKTSGNSLSEIPYGRIIRDAAAFDIPSHGSLGILGESNHIVALIADTKYGFRHFGNEGQVTLLRNAYNPDPYSDRGIHRIKLAVAACEQDGIDKIATSLLHPISYVSGSYHMGNLPMSGKMIELVGNARVSAVKGAEDKNGIIVRLYDISGKNGSVTLKLAESVSSAFITDTNESILSPTPFNGNTVSVDIPAFSVVTVKIILK